MQRDITLQLPFGVYRFNEEKHLHELDGKKLTGVTTILGVLSKPELYQWYADQAVTELGWVNPKYESKNTCIQRASDALHCLKQIEDGETYLKHLEKARLRGNAGKKKGGDIGTLVHGHIEKWIKDGTIPTGESQDIKMFEKFLTLVTGMEFTGSEQHLCSAEMWVGGICDFPLIKYQEKYYIGDYKSSRYVNYENFWQIGGYDLCMQEMGINKDIKIDGYVVINVNKELQTDIQFSYDRDGNQKAFKSCLDIYRRKEELKKIIK